MVVAAVGLKTQKITNNKEIYNNKSKYFHDNDNQSSKRRI